MKTDYGLKVPSCDRLREIFGTYERAWAVTGGDVAKAAFFVENPDKAVEALGYDRGKPDEDAAFATRLYDLCLLEREQKRAAEAKARAQQIAEASRNFKTRSEAAAALGVSVSVIARARAKAAA